jgi:hypothetical protein
MAPFFKNRRALLTSHWLCFSFGPNTEIKVPQITMATASILYVNAVSLLGEAIKTRLTPDELRLSPNLSLR